MSSPVLNPKQRVAIHAANLIENGMTVGLGTGSTANAFIDALAKRCHEEELQVRVIASSVISQIRAHNAGLSSLSLDELTGLDVYVDGADEVDPHLTLLKGRGQDLVIEKLLATHADTFYVLADVSKRVSKIGEKGTIPVEVKPNQWQLVRSQLLKHGGQGELRLNASGDNVFYTASGSLVLDMQFAEGDSASLNTLLSQLPGVVEHGIFYNVAKTVFIGLDDGIDVLQR